MSVYIVTKSEKWLKRAILPMALDEREIDESTLTMVRSSFCHVRVKAGMPSNVSAAEMRKYSSPTLLIAGEKDILFPGERVIARAKTIMPNLKTHLMEGCGHMSMLSSDKHKRIIKMIADFLEE